MPPLEIAPNPVRALLTVPKERAFVGDERSVSSAWSRDEDQDPYQARTLAQPRTQETGRGSAVPPPPAAVPSPELPPGPRAPSPRFVC